MLLEFLERITEIDKESECDGFRELKIGPILNLENKIVKKVLITQDPTLDALIYANKIKANFIISRTSLNFDKLKKIDAVISKKLFLIVQSRMMIYVLNSKWDNADFGANSCLIKLFGLEIDQPFILNEKGKYTSYGLFCKNSISNRNFNALLFDIKRNLGLEKVPYFKGSENSFKKILVSAGKRLDVKKLKKAYSYGCNCIITGELTYNELLFIKEYNMSVILISYYYSMKPGLEHLKRMLLVEFPQLDIDFFDLGNIINIYE